MKIKNKKYTCKVCGKILDKKYKNNLCLKHYEQMIEYGFTLDNNPRTEYDSNETVVVEDNHAEILLYDFLQEELDEKVIIDIEDVDRIKDIRWDKKSSCIVGESFKEKVLIENVIMNTKEKVIFNDGNYLNCKKENLNIVENKTKSKKVDKRKKGKVEITSLGTSTLDVTGSCWSIEYDKQDGTRGLILLENGICQGGTTLEDYNANKRMADYIPYDRAEFMIFSHIHGDHLLLSPASIPRGFKGKVIMTKEMKTLSMPLLLDGSFIHDRNVKELKNKGRKVEPLFTESDTYLLMNKVQEVDKNEVIKLNDEVSIRLVNNSHVIGAVQIELFIKKPSNHIVKILYTGDLGSKLNLAFQPFLVENEIVKKADIMICESTYGSSKRGFVKQECIDERRDLMKTLENTINNKSKCLIPSFSFSRSQTVMCMIYEHFKNSKENFQVVVDSRLTCEMNNAYREVLKGDDYEYWNKVLAWDRFKFITNFKDTDELSTKNDGIPRIILSSSGFMEAGHVRCWASRLMSDKNNTICFIGYSGIGTLADQIQNSNNPNIKIDGLYCIRRCKVKTYRTFSSHMQQQELINYFKQISIGSKILLHHGNKDAKYELKDKATEELHKVGKPTKIVVVDKNNDTFSI